MPALPLPESNSSSHHSSQYFDSLPLVGAQAVLPIRLDSGHESVRANIASRIHESVVSIAAQLGRALIGPK